MYVETTLLEAFIGFFFLSKRKNCEWCGKRFPKAIRFIKTILDLIFTEQEYVENVMKN